MALQLPTEIIEEFVKFASFSDESRHRLVPIPRKYPSLTSLCLTSRSFYSLSAPLLYRNIVVRNDITLIPKLLPLLSQSQRLLLASEVTQDQDIEIPQDQERIVDPAWVRRLVIYNGHPRPPGEENIPWRYLEEAVEGMKNLQSVIWEPKNGSSRLATILAGLPNLTDVTCSVTSPLYAPQPAPRLGGMNLKSLTVFHNGGTYVENTSGLQGLIYPSVKSLESLHLSFHNIDPEETNSRVAGMLKDVESLPKLQHLLLGGYELDTIEALGKAIDFSALKTLQLVRSEVCHELSRALLKDGGLPAMTKLSAVLVPSQVVELTSQCKGLRELHVVYSGDPDPTPIAEPARRIVESVVRHGRTLKALSLFIGYIHSEGSQGTALGVREVEMLLKECPGLEDLRINVDVKEFASVGSILSNLPHLRNLCIDLVDCSGSTSLLELPDTQTLIPLSAHWYDPENIDKREGPPSPVTAFEQALSQILSPMHHPNSLSHVCISSTGIDPSTSRIRFFQCYNLREVSEPVTEQIDPSLHTSDDEDEDDAYQFWDNLWIAPVGQRYAFENKEGVWIEIEVANGSEILDDIGKLGRWTTAFKAASMSTVRWEKPMM